MASSNAARLALACDACAAAASIGPAGGGATDAWCEACQRAARVEPGAAAVCPACGGLLATVVPRFPELWGALQSLDAVLAAWSGDPAPLTAMLPERPRFRTDLTPPEDRVDDPGALASALAALRRGEWQAAGSAPPGAGPRAAAARAIARERLGDATGAIREWTHVLESGPDVRARLARGALHARAHAWEEAGADFALAGDGPESRWNRASLRVHRAVASTPGMPAADAIAAARAVAGPALEYWSEPTVGRLAFTLLAERALARREAGELGDSDLVALRDGEDLLEHATFWDRALVLAAQARLGIEGGGDAARVALPLAREIAAALLAEPPVKGAALADLRAALETTWDAIGAFEPRAARAALAPWIADKRLRRYRLPCAACGRGSVGVVGFDEVARDAGPEGGATSAARPEERV